METFHFEREPVQLPPRPGDLLQVAGNCYRGEVSNGALAACFDRWADGEWTWEQALGAAVIVLNNQLTELRTELRRLPPTPIAAAAPAPPAAV